MNFFRSLSAVFVVAVTAAGVTGCNSDGEGGGRPTVVFEVSGATEVRELEYHSEDGLTTVTAPVLPWRAEGRYVSKHVVMVKADSTTMDPLTCTITIDGKVVVTSTQPVAVCTTEVP